MHFTDEQNTVVFHEGNARVKALAGTGKSSTLVEYARNRPKSRILYIVYNRSAKQDAILKFKKAGITNVRVETAHSLAYAELDVKKRFVLHKNGGCKPLEIVDIFNLSKYAKEGNRIDLIMAKHIISCLNLYCNSSAQNIEEIDYIKSVKDNRAKSFVDVNIGNIYKACKLMLDMMHEGKLEISHDAYLKLWQLSKPKLDYDIILIDEAQDTSNVMLSAFLEQEHAIRIMVGDEHQQIYSFRHAVNSLDKVDYPELYLTKSFRFTQDIADRAIEAIGLKVLLGSEIEHIKMKGLGGRKNNAFDYAVLARHNLTLFDAAIQSVFVEGNKDIYFEGDIKNYIYMRQGGGLFDILNLYQEKSNCIKDPLIASFNSISELEEYHEATDDMELSLMINMVKKYKKSLGYYICKLKEYQTKKENAQIIFSTVHKSKGMEYNIVKLCNDFITKMKIIELLNPNIDAYYAHGNIKDPKLKAYLDKNGHERMIKHMINGHESKIVENDKLIEEINILYVALTRARQEVNFEPFT